MLRRLSALAAVVALVVVVAFVRAGAFPLWGSSHRGQARPQGSAPMQLAAKANEPAASAHPEPAPAGVAVASFAPLVKQVVATVVNVSVVQRVKASGFGMFGPGEESPELPFGPEGNPFEQFRRFFGPTPHEFKQHGLGSGVIVSSDGYILTNEHVVGHADQIHVRLTDKREFTAKVVGKDAKTDLALIKIKTEGPLPAAVLGDSAGLQVGDWVVAIGNPFGFNFTVTAGIISAKGRILGGNYDNFLQTDASINPGNSGGPLFNTRGEVVGINTAIYSSTGSNAGIGFAIPVNLAKNVMEQLKEHGRVIRGWLGVEIQEVTPDLAHAFGLPKPEGALVAGVEGGGPAEKAGIKQGDVIVKFDGRPVQSEHQLPELVAQTPVHKKVAVEVVRNGKHLTVEATIGELKEEQVALARGEQPGFNWGLEVQDITPEIANRLNLSSAKGVIVRNVKPDTPAADAGIQRGDIVREVNHQKTDSVSEFLSLAAKAKKSKKPALLLVQRGKNTIYVIIKPEG
jgi:serine protease Do